MSHYVWGTDLHLSIVLGALVTVAAVMLMWFLYRRKGERLSIKSSAQESHWFQPLWDSATDAVVILKNGSVCQSCNLSFAHLLGATDVSEIKGHSLTQVERSPFFQRLFELNEKDFPSEHVIRYVDKLEKDHTQWFDIAKSVYRPPASQQTYFLVIARDISSWYVSNPSSEPTPVSVRSDEGISQLMDRSGFDEMLDVLWHLHVREHQPLAVIICDVDQLEKYNEFYGRDAGDEALSRIAQAIHNVASRTSDCVAHYGGGIFAFVLPNTRISGACFVAEKVHSELKQIYIRHQASEVANHVTVSMGVVSFIPKSVDKPENFVDYANQALQQAKEQGRNRTCVYYNSLQR
jgi:diguanylate cyclase (GGDEF)-like protein/PAS domain S-box-containing protein